MKTETIRARIDPVLKIEAEKIFDELGLTPSTTIKMLYRQIVYTRALSFEVRIPNKATISVMEDLKMEMDTKQKQ
jgi:DNA-damage-inducible protein J